MEEANDGSFSSLTISPEGSSRREGESAPAPDPHARFHVSSLVPRGKKPYKFPVKRS